MQFTVLINQLRALEWGLNAQQAILFAYLYGCPAWAKTIMVDEDLYFKISKTKVCADLPLLTNKPNTIHKILKSLESIGLIKMAVFDNETHVSLTKKAAFWNQSVEVENFPPLEQKESEGWKKIHDGVEKNPQGGGKKSTLGVENFPTNQSISNQSIKLNNYTTKNHMPKKIELDYSVWPELPSEQTLSDWITMRKRLRADVSQTVINRFALELAAAKSFGYSVDDCLAECVTRRWHGFKHQWLLGVLGGGSRLVSPSAGPPLDQKFSACDSRGRSLQEDLTDRTWAIPN